MTSVTFETGVLRDALNSAERVAAKNGEILEQFGGLVLELDPADVVVHVRSTNRDVFYDEWITALDITTDEPTNPVWRLAPKVLMQILRSLPMSGQSKVTLAERGNLVALSCTRTKTVAEFLRLPYDNYPQWSVAPEDGLAPVEDFGTKLSLIEWACGSRETETLAYLSGVRIDGRYLIATDRLKLAAIPCEMPLSETVTVPTDQLSMLTKELGDVLVGVVDGSLIVAPTEYNQIRSTPFDKSLDQKAVDRIMNRDYEHSLRIDVSETKTVIDRVSAVLGANGHVRIILGNEEMYLEAEDYSGVERVADSVAVPGQAMHDPVRIICNPTLFTDAIGRSKAATVTLHYDASSSRGKARLYVQTGDYEVWFMEIRPMKEDS